MSSKQNNSNNENPELVETEQDETEQDETEKKQEEQVVTEEDTDTDPDLDPNLNYQVFKQEENSIALQLGDVISIRDPTNEMLNNHIFIIDYIDSNRIKLIDERDLKPIELKINDKMIGSGTITGIDLLSRNDEIGYARQNGLLPGKWINIYFGGDIPLIITGEITNLEEDMIEVRILDQDNNIIYINFDYKGLPEDLPIETIEIRPAPSTSTSNKIQIELEETGLDQNQEPEQNQEYDPDYDLEEGEIYEEKEKEENVVPVSILKEDVKHKIKKMIIEADQIEFGDYLNPIEEYIDIAKDKYRYNIDAQTNDLLDELLSTVPNNQRTNSVLNNIHIMITRFLQLREIGSVFDKNKNVVSIIKKSADDKPLAEYLSSFKNTLYWILVVAQNIKKVYNVDEVESPDITILNTFESIKRMEDSFNNYKSNASTESINKYNNLYTSLNSEMTPFLSLTKEQEQSNNIICEQEVTSNMNVIINNLNDLYSSVAKNSNVTAQRFVIQKYNLGLNRLQTTNMKGPNMIAHTVNLTNNDMLSVNSILTLPEPTVRFSQINLPGSSIFTKANLNLHFLNYWQLLKKNTIVNTVKIDNLNTELELDYNSDNFVDNIKNYFLDIDIDAELNKNKNKNSNNKNNKNTTNLDIYKNFLKIIIPKIRVLFNLVKKYIKGKLSIVDVVSYLEPFVIYTSDLTYNQYVEISKFIRVQISEYNRKLIENGRKMSILKNISQQNRYSSILLDILSSNGEITDRVWEKYGLTDVGNKSNKNTTSNSEILKKITLDDFGNLFNTSVAFENISLMYPTELNDIFELDKNKLNKTYFDDEQQNKCKNYVLSKKYLTREELEMDNGKVIYFDKAYDNTPYDLLDNFLKEQNMLASEDFQLFLSEKLQKKYKYRLEDAEYTADSLANGYKKVKEGQYAILMDENKNKNNEMKYFMRKSNQWIEDKSIDKDTFLNDTESLCLVQPECLPSTSTSTDEPNCESLDMNKDTIVSNALKEILNQFDKKYEITKEELTNKLNKYLERYMSIFDKLENVKNFQFYKYNNIQYEIGLKENMDSINGILSPHIKLRDLILGQSDFIKKQNDLLQFCSKFTRPFQEGRVDINSEELETMYWLYCIDTNTKLVPAFLFTLAKVLTQNPAIYDNTINNIVKEQGALSDDGDSWVDKYSGYVIKAIDWDVEEGYDEGFKIISRAVLEEDLGQTMMANTKLSKKFNNPQAQVINNIITSLASFMGVQLDSQAEFIIKIVTNLINDSNIMEKEKTYEKRVEEMSKKGKKLPEYKFVYNSAFLYLTLGMYLIAIQTSIPSIRSRKTFPGCVRSFTGFPIQGDGEYSGLNYIACVVNKLKSPAAPWYVLERMKEDKIAEKIKIFITQYLLPNQEVNQMIKNKVEYLLQNPEEEIPLEHSLLKWTNFLPPLMKFKIKGLQNVSSGYLDLLLKDIRAGSFKQNEKILVVKSKIIEFSLAIQEAIQKIIEKKELLLKNSIHPYMDNACCNEHDNKTVNLTTLQYFINDNREIEQYNVIINQLTAIVNDVNSLTEAGLYLSKINTKRYYPPLPKEYSEITIYQTFIKYCNFNNLIPINSDLFALCKDKPENISFNDSIEEQIRKLKRDGRNYNEPSMLRLVQIVSNHNIIDQESFNIYYTPVQRLRDIIDMLDTTNDDTIAKSLITLLNNSLDTYDISVREDTENMRKMKNYLDTSNSKMRKQLLDFIKQKGKIKGSEYKKVDNFIKNLTVWEFDKNQNQNQSQGQSIDETNTNTKTKINDKISDDAMYNYIQFFKTFISMLSKVYPNMILNKTLHSINIPKYWGLSKNHSNEIKSMITDNYESIQKFYGNKNLSNILLKIQDKCKNLNILANETPALTSIKVNNKGTTRGTTTGTQIDLEEIYSVFDKRTSTLLFEYYLLQVLTSYIDLTENPLMIKRLVPEKTNVRDDLFYEGEGEGQGLGLGLGQYDQESKFETVEPDYISGDMNELKKSVAELLKTYILIMNSSKDTINISYEKVMDRVFKLKEKEKDTFTDRLRELSDEAREVDTILKINKLGNWNKGLLKGLKEYDPDNYDQEKIVMQNVTELERKIRKSNANVNENNMDLYVEDYAEDMEASNFEENEERNISNMSEDYMDGYDYNEVEEEDAGEYY